MIGLFFLKRTTWKIFFLTSGVAPLEFYKIGKTLTVENHHCEPSHSPKSRRNWNKGGSPPALSPQPPFRLTIRRRHTNWKDKWKETLWNIQISIERINRCVLASGLNISHSRYCNLTTFSHFLLVRSSLNFVLSFSSPLLTRVAPFTEVSSIEDVKLFLLFEFLLLPIS